MKIIAAHGVLVCSWVVLTSYFYQNGNKSFRCKLATKKVIFGNHPIDVKKYEEIRDELLKFGLTSNQIKVFFYLGKFGSKTAIEISRNLRMPRTETYHLLSALQSKGMVVSSFNHPTKFSAIPFDKAMVALLNAESERLKSLKNSEGILKKLWAKIPNLGSSFNEIEEEKFQILRGENQVKSKIIDMISNAEKKFLILGCENDFLRFYRANFLEFFENSSIDFKFLTSTSENAWYIFDDIDKSNIRQVANSVIENLCFLIKDDKEILIFVQNSKIIQKEVIALWTNSKSLIYSNILLFKSLWSIQSESIIEQKISK